jgi:tRNA(Arg) A34 adenosine deaminase TadA
MSACLMCAGAAVLYRVNTVVIRESKKFNANEDLLRQYGIDVVLPHDAETLEVFTQWAADNRELWGGHSGTQYSINA